MAVTDLTDSLPWWARQGGPGPTGGPGAAPQGSGGVGGQPPPGMNQQAWLQYLMQMFSPGAAQAGEAPPSASNGGPSPDDIAALKAAQANPTAPIPNNDIVPPVGPPPAPALRPAGISQPAGVSASGLPLQPGSLAPGALAQFGRGAGGPIGSGGNVPWPSGGGSMSPTAPPPAGQTAPGSVAGPLASGGATASGASANPRFIGIDQPNASPQNSLRAGPQATALNLAGLFGGGQGGAVAPARAAGPLAKRAAPSSDDWDIDADGNVVPRYGPPGQSRLASAPTPPIMPDDIKRQRAMQLAAASLKQRYG